MDRGIVNLKCKYCGNNQSHLEQSTGKAKFKYYCYCTQCRKPTLFTNSESEIRRILKPLVECPYCHSTNTKKISTTSKVAGVATFGVFALGKATKEWHCNNCKSNF